VRFDFDLRKSPNVVVQSKTGLSSDLHSVAWRLDRRIHHFAHHDFWRSPSVERLRTIREFRSDVALSVPGYIHPELNGIANVLIVPDIQHEYHPEFFSQDALDERRRLYTDSINRAAHICAISEFTRQTLIERLHVAPDKVTTTPLAADPIYEPGNPARRDVNEVLKRHGLSYGDYLIFPGNTWHHKNHQAALRALRILQDEYGLKPHLISTGAAKEAQRELHQQIHDLGLLTRVRFLGYRPVEEMPALYEGAAALVFPSLFEGFGMPVLEAMWSSCPVVCGNVSSLPEVAGDAALLIDPLSPEELASALARVLTDTALRQQLVLRGRQQARRFSWARFTMENIRILQRTHADAVRLD
jgi:glycosyltransferase involved in cell wall biosynthesis